MAFYRIEVQVISNPSSRLEKHQTPVFFAYARFFMNLKKANFSHFPHTNILFYVNMLVQTQCSLNCHFFTIILSRL